MEPVKPIDASAVSKAKAFVIRQMETHPQPALMFHNLKHTHEVAATAYQLGQMENLSSSDLILLQVAAWFHDLGYLSTYIGHEESSAAMAKEFLEAIQMSDDGIQQVLDLISATKFNHRPETELEKILVDADRANMGSREFLQKGELLRHEWKVYLSKTYNDIEWLEHQLNYIQTTAFNTESAKSLFEANRQFNIGALQDALGAKRLKRQQEFHFRWPRQWEREGKGLLRSLFLGILIAITMNVAVLGSEWRAFTQGLLSGILIGLILRWGDKPFDKYITRKFNFPTTLAMGTGLLLSLFIGAEIFTLTFVQYIESGDWVISNDFLQPSLYLGLAWNAFLLSLILNIIKLTSRIIGPQIFWSYLRGKYHKPVGEERIFMFIDLNSSTGMAETMSLEKYHSLLRNFFNSLSGPVARFNGEIYQYVGDEAVITWPMKEGLNGANCLRCYHRIVQTVERQQRFYIRKYGFMPDFKVAIHGGWVIAGEIGKTKADIVFHGDVMNTTERILQQCRNMGQRLLMSEYIAKRLDFPAPMQAVFIDTLTLKGKKKSIGVYTVSTQTVGMIKTKAVDAQESAERQGLQRQ
jgi:adenylate cyclase